MSEEKKDLREETEELKEIKREEVENKERRLGKKIFWSLLAVAFILVYGVIAFVFGQISNEIKVEKAQQEADAKVEVAQQEANAKIEAFEKKALEECDEQKYQMLEECFENREKVRRGEPISFTLSNLKMDGISFPNLDFWNDSVDDTEILAYVNALKEIAEKYYLSYDINIKVIVDLERLEEECKDKIHDMEIFEAIWALKEQCNKNTEIWN